MGKRSRTERAAREGRKGGEGTVIFSWPAVFDDDPVRRRRLIAMAEACLAALRSLERERASSEAGHAPEPVKGRLN
jgi:hypothetical protein